MKPRASRDGETIRKQRIVRMSDAEWKFIKKKAAELGMTASELIRRRSLQGMPIKNEAYSA